MDKEKYQNSILAASKSSKRSIITNRGRNHIVTKTNEDLDQLQKLVGFREILGMVLERIHTITVSERSRKIPLKLKRILKAENHGQYVQKCLTIPTAKCPELRPEKRNETRSIMSREQRISATEPVSKKPFLSRLIKRILGK